jgi:hypothetical protein
MKRIMIVLLALIMTAAVNEAKAQLWTVDDRTLDNPTDYYSNRNGTYFFQADPNKNMGTSPNNAVFKNEASFYNKDNNTQRTLFPTSVGQHYTPGSQGYNYNGGNYINNNTSGSYNNSDVNGRTAPVYMNATPPGTPPVR